MSAWEKKKKHLFSVPSVSAIKMQIVAFQNINYRHIDLQLYNATPMVLKILYTQECIPVGCLPAARRPYAGVCFPGGCLLPGVSALGGLLPGGCLLRGVSALGGGVSAPGGLLLGGVVSQHALRQTPL